MLFKLSQFMAFYAVGIFYPKRPSLPFFFEFETMISMIHNSSNDPVLIKKISLKIWSLRDEIEARIQDKIDGGAADIAEEEILKICMPALETYCV